MLHYLKQNFTVWWLSRRHFKGFYIFKKDINDNKIHEGDILFCSNEDPSLFVVVWNSFPKKGKRFIPKGFMIKDTKGILHKIKNNSIIIGNFDKIPDLWIECHQCQTEEDCTILLERNWVSRRDKNIYAFR